jgi:hypothetical protein
VHDPIEAGQRRRLVVDDTTPERRCDDAQSRQSSERRGIVRRFVVRRIPQQRDRQQR